jgi:hypothetical protein
MTTVELLNFYSYYVNKIITFYYIIGSGNGHIKYDNVARFNEAINLMELGFGPRYRRARVNVEEIEVDIESPLPKLTLIHPDDCPDDCSSYTYI